MLIRTVIFDADGVVISPVHRSVRHFEVEHGITQDMARGFFAGVYRDCLVGKAELKKELSPFLPAWGWPGSVDDFVSTWFEAENVVDARLVDTIYNLRQCGVTCCLASNQEKRRAEYMVAEMRFGDLFDRLFFSCDLGYMKPNHAFFESIADSLHTAGQGLLFWDDTLKHVQAARACGWHAELYTGFEDFEAKLDSYLRCGGDQ
jgi:putative hydrolase of the HAD superfamily